MKEDNEVVDSIPVLYIGKIYNLQSEFVICAAANEYDCLKLLDEFVESDLFETQNYNMVGKSIVAIPAERLKLAPGSLNIDLSHFPESLLRVEKKIMDFIDGVDHFVAFTKSLVATLVSNHAKTVSSLEQKLAEAMATNIRATEEIRAQADKAAKAKQDEEAALLREAQAKEELIAAKTQLDSVQQADAMEESAILASLKKNMDDLSEIAGIPGAVEPPVEVPAPPVDVVEPPVEVPVPPVDVVEPPVEVPVPPVDAVVATPVPPVDGIPTFKI